MVVIRPFGVLLIMGRLEGDGRNDFKTLEWVEIKIDVIRGRESFQFQGSRKGSM